MSYLWNRCCSHSASSVRYKVIIDCRLYFHIFFHNRWTFHKLKHDLRVKSSEATKHLSCGHHKDWNISKSMGHLCQKSWARPLCSSIHNHWQLEEFLLSRLSHFVLIWDFSIEKANLKDCGNFTKLSLLNYHFFLFVFTKPMEHRCNSNWQCFDESPRENIISFSLKMKFLYIIFRMHQ